MLKVIPLVIFVGLVALMAFGLGKDPTIIPSPLIGQSLPSFSLDQVDASGVITEQDFLPQGKAALVNVWGSWCVACRVEHPFLMQLAAQQRIPLYGINWRDDREQAVRWLNQYGDPYTLNAYDPKGEAIIDLGVYGAPETFLIDAQGTILYKVIGPLTTDIWQNEIVPLLNEL